jgi:hypothetical protein
MRLLAVLIAGAIGGCATANPFPSYGPNVGQINLPGPQKGRACIAMGPDDKKQIVRVDTKDVFCNERDQVYMVLNTIETAGAGRVYLQDYGNRGGFLCHLNQKCPISSPGIFVGTVKPIKVGRYDTELEIERSDPALANLE